MQDVLNNCESRMNKCISSLEGEYLSMRTGKASTALFDKIKVDYYGSETPLNQVASISSPEARLIVIQPWDKSVLPAIEKAIQKSELGLNPNNDGKLIRVSFPPLTQERRKELAKSAKASAEGARVAIRNVRRDAMEELKKLQKNGDISEDQQKDGENKIQKMTDKAIDQVANLQSRVFTPCLHFLRGQVINEKHTTAYRLYNGRERTMGKSTFPSAYSRSSCRTESSQESDTWLHK